MENTLQMKIKLEDFKTENGLVEINSFCSCFNRIYESEELKDEIPEVGIELLKLSKLSDGGFVGKIKIENKQFLVFSDIYRSKIIEIS